MKELIEALEVSERASRLRDLIDALEKCAGSLEAEIDARYPWEARKIYPDQQRRYDRNMSDVLAARSAIAAWNAREGDDVERMAAKLWSADPMNDGCTWEEWLQAYGVSPTLVNVAARYRKMARAALSATQADGIPAAFHEALKLREILKAVIAAEESGEGRAPAFKAAKAMLAAATQADGWVMVPREPTEAMIDSLRDFAPYNVEDIGPAIWSAMLAAAAPSGVEG